MVDKTIAAVELPVVGAHLALAERWLRRLTAMGTSHGDGYLWLGERGEGHRAVEAYIPQTATVKTYLAEVAHLVGEAGPEDLPDIPARVDGLGVHGKRALLLGLTTLIRQVRADPSTREDTRAAIIDTLDRLLRLTANLLNPEDPMALVTRCRVADIRLHTLRQTKNPGLDAPLRDLMKAMDDCERAHRAGRLDSGLLAELIYSGNVEINAVRRANATRPDSGLPSPADLNTRLRRAWTHYLDLVGIDPGALDAEDPDLAEQAGYHLSAYASFLAGQDDEDDLRTAAHLFEHVVLPARRNRHARTLAFQPLRESLQTASRATTELARRVEAPEARRWAALGYEWIVSALAHGHTQHLIKTGRGDTACNFALLAAPALLTAVEHRVSPDPTADITQAQDLVQVAVDSAQRLGQGDPRNYARWPEIERLEAWLSEVSVMPVHEHQQVAPRRGG